MVLVIGLICGAESIASEETLSGSTSFRRDGTVKAKYVSRHHKDGKIIQTQVYDSAGNLEFTEIPRYDSAGRRTNIERLDPAGKPWPYGFPVYGAAANGGLGKLEPDIRQLCSILGSGWILEIVFVGPNRVEVKTGVIRGFLNGSGRNYDFQKEGETWIELDKNIIKRWVS